jgi:hypothetical protein
MPLFDSSEAEAQRTTDQPMSRFRPRFRKLTDEELALHDAIKGGAHALEQMFTQVDLGSSNPETVSEKMRYRALAMTALEQAVMWAVKALTL